MKKCFLLLFSLVSSIAVANTISGTIVKSGNFYFLRQNLVEPGVILNPINEPVTNILTLLKSGDQIISATTEGIDLSSPKVNLSSIEYVGLRRLLGSWKNDHSSIDFQSFTEVIFQEYSGLSKKSLVSYKYSISPSSNKEWYIFLSNDQKTNVGILSFSNLLETLTLKIYDSEGDGNPNIYQFNRK